MSLVALLLLGCSGGGGDSGVVLQGPVLTHQQPDAGLAEGSSVELVVQAEDPDGVEEVVLWHRELDSDYWDTTPLQDQGDGSWSLLFGPLQAPGHAYWFRASDLGQPSAVSDLPEQGPDAPLVLDVTRQALTLPFSEGFEDADEPAELGWWTPSTGAAGYPWELTGGTAGEGAQAAVHWRGSSSVGELEDWLVSPVLDLRDVGPAMVSWWELGASTAVLAADAAHELWLSTGSRDPADGDFELVASLPAPGEETWARAPAVDLSAWQDQPEVSLAWVSRGEAADDWWLDQVLVGARGIDLVEPVLSWTPEPARPGDAVALSLSLRNAMDAVADGGTATLILPEGGGSLEQPTAALGEIAGLAEVQAAWELVLDADLAEPARLPLELTVDVDGQQWAWPLELVVGEEAQAVLSWTQDTGGVVLVELGVGDPDDPLLALSVDATWREAGSHELVVDLTDQGAWLPPAPGPSDRWYARMDAGADGVVDSFSISAAGESQAATVLPAFDADLPSVVYLPEPPRPTLASLSTDPDPVSPGDSGVSLTLELLNEGATTAGALSGRLSSDDADATVAGCEDLALIDGPWEAGSSLLVEGCTVDVAASHLDSTPLQLLLELDDGLDSWSQAVLVDLPWPVPRVVGIGIADEGGDELLDGGESATLTLTLGNGGTLATDGALALSPAVAPDSPVSATVSVDDGSLGELEPDDRASVDLELVVGEGSSGDRLDLVLSLQDDRSSWQLPLALVLGEVPWITLAPASDAAGDAVDDYPFDIVDARFRSVSGSFQLEVDSATAFDLDAIFFEAWGRASDTPYSYYRWVVQPGGAQLEGYVSGSGFTDIGLLAATAPDALTLRLEWTLADMELVEDAFTIGLAAGWCGPDSYYCDHHPDGWGYPYVGFSSAMFFPVEW